MLLRKRQRMMKCFRSQGALQHSKRMWTAELVNRWCCLASAKRDKVRRTRFSVKHQGQRSRSIASKAGGGPPHLPPLGTNVIKKANWQTSAIQA